MEENVALEVLTVVTVESTVFWAVMLCTLLRCSPKFWRNILPPSEKQDKQKASCFLLATCMAYSMTLKMDAVYSSEMLVKFYQATQHYILVHLLRKCNSYTLFWCLYSTLSYGGTQTADHGLFIFCITSQAVYVDIETKNHEPTVTKYKSHIFEKYFPSNRGIYSIFVGIVL
jgi:hypothetical protein